MSLQELFSYCQRWWSFSNGSYWRSIAFLNKGWPTMFIWTRSQANAILQNNATMTVTEIKEQNKPKDSLCTNSLMRKFNGEKYSFTILKKEKWSGSMCRLCSDVWWRGASLNHCLCQMRRQGETITGLIKQASIRSKKFKLRTGYALWRTYQDQQGRFWKWPRNFRDVKQSKPAFLVKAEIYHWLLRRQASIKITVNLQRIESRYFKRSDAQSAAGWNGLISLIISLMYSWCRVMAAHTVSEEPGWRLRNDYRREHYQTLYTVKVVKI